MFAAVRQRPQTDFDAATTLMEIGRSDSEIVQLTGIPRCDRQRVAPRAGVDVPPAQSQRDDRLAAAIPRGLLLPPGDLSWRWLHQLSLESLGSAHHRRWTPRYPGVVAEVESAIGDVLPDIPVRRYLRTGGSVTAIHACHPALPFAFPQHGPGRKHLRPHRPRGLAARADGARSAPDSFADSFIRTAAERSIVSRRSCRADVASGTSIRATSSRTCRPISAPSSATTATCSRFGGRSRTRGTSRSRIGGASLV